MEPGKLHKKMPEDTGMKLIKDLNKLRNASGSNPTAQICRKMQRVMQNNAAVFHTQSSFEEGVKNIHKDVAVTDQTMILSTDLVQNLESKTC
ncbi:hypothetical protein PTTG_06022 [Puccinia triticina 1-1 BBBD Race 1]|uniref:Succ_DH_flav_C domain-containing protein n=2 Tax=Puccinia triticina TaxID=208348 RepID=A0A0C4EYW7_PUCT1|nr:hypothetical protein PTTG_06022 [Puccinia triticina 1-1 BBBD Race 1]